MWITPLPPSLTASGEGSHGSNLSGNYVASRLSSGWKSTNEYLIAEKTALAEFESAEASVESQKIRLNQTTIVAPDDGLITTRSVQLGTVVSSGSELFRLLRQRRVEWQAEVPARYLACIRTGMPAKVVGDGGMLIDGTVRLVGPTVSTNTGRVMVYVALPASVHPPSGLYVTGEIELAVTTALTVPQTALVMRDGMTYVFTVEADRHVKRVRVETGRRNSDEVEILSDLDASANVVTTGGAFLSSGALVRLEGDAQ
ncbi:Nickel and cobalt resistance protein CnrB [Hartmannibacter diazotrophicus]|uniref:Nickel and cobalt resistance protein CnrB n=1 Tax=Hartmannibacter diazotrophicus TaxID=1482074 RepID=A0A2C9D8V3_9HYPH|nr:Nickel and cobalt resistance protein CnrB [Hartmannibacter diazotrophicus]